MDYLVTYVGLMACILAILVPYSKPLKLINLNSRNLSYPNRNIGSRNNSQIGNHNSTNKIFLLNHSQINNSDNKPHMRIIRLSKDRIIKSRQPILNSDSNIQQTDKHLICKTIADVNTKLSNNRTTYTGSKSHTFAERGNDTNTLLCKSKAFRHVDENGVLTREAVDATSVVSNDKDLLKTLNNVHVKNPKAIEVGTVGSSAIAENAAKNDAVSAVNTEAKDAKASVVSKSKKVAGFLETASSAEGKTKHIEEGVLVKSKGVEKTRLQTKPSYSVRNPSGRSSGYAILQLSHNKTTDFEIET